MSFTDRQGTRWLPFIGIIESINLQLTYSCKFPSTAEGSKVSIAFLFYPDLRFSHIVRLETFLLEDRF